MTEQPAYLTPGDAPGEYRVDTPVLEGLLGRDGTSFGLLPMRWKPMECDLAGMVGLLTYYRVFTTNHRYCESMRALPSATRWVDSHTVRVRWSSNEERPFSLTAIYHWTAPDTVDVETIVKAEDLLPDFEVFLSSYGTPDFPASRVYCNVDAGNKAFLSAEQQHGDWHAFPRDDAAVAIIKDGRWDLEPNPVDWAVRPHLAAPLVYRRNEKTGMTIILMARPEDCFAVCSSHDGEVHYSMYFCLFGRTLEPGAVVRARVRMVMGVFDDAAVIQRYEAFLNSNPANNDL